MRSAECEVRVQSAGYGVRSAVRGAGCGTGCAVRGAESCEVRPLAPRTNSALRTYFALRTSHLLRTSHPALRTQDQREGSLISSERPRYFRRLTLFSVTVRGTPLPLTVTVTVTADMSLSPMCTGASFWLL